MTTIVGAYQFSLLSFFLALSGICGILHSLYLYRHKHTPATGHLALMQLSAASWAIFYCLEYSAIEQTLKLLWAKYCYFGISLTPVWFYLFSQDFVSRKKTGRTIKKVSLITIALFFILIVFTNDFHHLHWKSINTQHISNITTYYYGPTFWLIFVSIYTIILSSIYNILKIANRFSNQLHPYIGLIIFACAMPIAGNVLYVFKINPIPGFDWTPSFFILSGMILAYINIHFDSAGIIPFAHKKIIDLMEEGVIFVNDQNRVVDINQPLLAQLNKTRSSIIGKKLTEIFSSKKELIEKLQGSNDSFQFEIPSEIVTDKRVLDIKKTLIFDKNDKLSGELITFRDITERKNYEEKIISTNEALKNKIVENEKLIADLDAFAHTVAHDLRGSISGIASWTDLLIDRIEQQDYQSALRNSQMIYSSTEKTLHVISEILTMATIQQQDIKLEKVNMGKVIEESEKRLKEQIQQSKATIIKPDHWPIVKGNAAWIEEVWVNYIGNAIKYGGSPPVIELGAKTQSDKVTFWVKDNGHGLSTDEQSKLFQKFSRLDSTKTYGTGLGLSIVKRIVEKLGGEVGVTSDSNDGSTFYFTLKK